MNEFIRNIQLLIVQNTALTYIIVYIGTVLIGNIMTFSALWIAFHGTLGPYGALFVILTTYAADITGDLTWFSLGRSLPQTRLGQWIHGKIPRREAIEAYIKKNDSKIVFLSKFIYSTTFMFIFSVGWSGMRFKRFIRASLATITIAVPTVTLVVYGLFKLFTRANALHLFRKIEILFSVALIVFILLNYLVSKAAKKIFFGRGL